MPLGCDAEIEERDINISGGQLSDCHKVDITVESALSNSEHTLAYAISSWLLENIDAVLLAPLVAAILLIGMHQIGIIKWNLRGTLYVGTTLSLAAGYSFPFIVAAATPVFPILIVCLKPLFLLHWRSGT